MYKRIAAVFELTICLLLFDAHQLFSQEVICGRIEGNRYSKPFNLAFILATTEEEWLAGSIDDTSSKDGVATYNYIELNKPRLQADFSGPDGVGSYMQRSKAILLPKNLLSLISGTKDKIDSSNLLLKYNVVATDAASFAIRFWRAYSDVYPADAAEAMQTVMQSGVFEKTTSKGKYIVRGKPGLGLTEIDFLANKDGGSNYKFRSNVPIAPSAQSWSGVIESRYEYKGKPEFYTLKVEVEFRKNDIRLAKELIAQFKNAIPDKFRVISDTAITMEWNGSAIVPAVDPQKVKTAQDIRFEEFKPHNETNWPLIIVGALIAIGLGIYGYRRWRSSMSLLLAIVLFSNDPSKTYAQNTGPYCGIYCVYAAANLLRVPSDFEQFLTTDYVSSLYGSSSQDLIRALESIQLQADARSSMSLSTLRLLKNPAILHVRTIGPNSKFGHWILFLGFTEDGKLKVFDPPNASEELTKAELLSIWDGTGIVIFKPSETNKEAFYAWPWETLLITILSLLSLVILRKRLSATMVLLISPIVAGLLGCLLYPSVFLQSNNAVQNVEAAYFRGKVPKIDHDKFLQMQTQAEVLVIDTRLYPAFSHGHIPGAIHVPVSTSYIHFRKMLEKIPRSATLIFYCQNEKCGWANITASYFLPRGYQNCFVYEGGYNQWIDAGGKVEKGDEP